MERYFVDTGAWFAVQVQDDENHVSAAETFQALLLGPRTLVTTNQVIGETYTLLRIVRGYRQAAKFLDSIDNTNRLERVFVTAELEGRAFALLHRYSDHDFSFVDATSFAVMKAHRLHHAFAFDAHFATAGFVRIPSDLPIEQL